MSFLLFAFIIKKIISLPFSVELVGAKSFSVSKLFMESIKSGSIYGRRKIDVESVFGGLKACLGFRRFSVRGLEKVKREAGIALMAMNIRKLVAKNTNYNYFITQKKEEISENQRTIFTNLFCFEGLMARTLFITCNPK